MAELLEQLLALPEAQRRDIAVKLFESLPPELPERFNQPLDEALAEAIQSLDQGIWYSNEEVMKELDAI